MTREKAVSITRALNDIEDFEMFYEGIIQLYNKSEGDFNDFVRKQLLPLMDAELDRRKQILENM